MGRWQPDTRERLEHAAMTLFTEQGFAATTVPEITARAGLTTRTFFRYFADKREVLFAGQDDVPALAAAMAAEAPAGLDAMTVIEQGLDIIAARQFEGRRDALRHRRAIVQGDAGLRERDLQKQAALVDGVRRAFRSRGEDELTATLAAHLCVTVVGVSVGRWLATDDDVPLGAIMHATFDALRALAAPPVRTEPTGGTRRDPAVRRESTR